MSAQRMHDRWFLENADERRGDIWLEARVYAKVGRRVSVCSVIVTDDRMVCKWRPSCCWMMGVKTRKSLEGGGDYLFEPR